MLQSLDKKKIIYFVFGIVIAILLFGLYFSQREKIPEDNSSESEELPIIYLNDMFYAEGVFRNGVEKAEDTATRDDVQAIIVPHHLLASEIIASIMKQTSGRNIDTIIIIGPNHENIGTNKIATVKAKWQTPLGYVESDQEMVEKFLLEFKLKFDMEVFQNEHSIGAMASFIKYYFPDAKILPIVFDSYADKEEAEKVGEWLSQNFDQNSLLVTSVDFSHYLTKDEADQKDIETRELIEKRDIEAILKLSNTENVDSPVSLATSLIFAEKNGLETDILYNANSFDFSVIKPVETTSYFGIIFSK